MSVDLIKFVFRATNDIKSIQFTTTIVYMVHGSMVLVMTTEILM